MSDLLKERQEDELQVLQAVFMGDYEDLRTKDAWKVMKLCSHCCLGVLDKFSCDGCWERIPLDDCKRIK